MTVSVPFSASTPLLETLERSRELGFLGPSPLDAQVQHASGFADAARSRIGDHQPVTLLDLGSGGGLPGLVLAERWPDVALVLLDANERRTSFLKAAIEALGWNGRVGVIRERAEIAGHDPSLRAVFDLVVARSFGPPPVTAECGAPFLRVGGALIVSEPPEELDRSEGESGDVSAGSLRWPPASLSLVGLAPAGKWQGRYGYQVLCQEEPCPSRYPRRVGIVAKRPLYSVPSTSRE